MFIVLVNTILQERLPFLFVCGNYVYTRYFILPRAHHDLYQELNISEIVYDKFMEEYLIQDKILWNQVLDGKIDLNQLRILRPYRTFKNLGINKSKEYCKEFYLKMFNILIDKVSIDKKINRILANLKENYKLYILTNGFVKEQEMKIRKLGINKYFDSIFISESIGYEKPDLGAFSFLINKLKIKADSTVIIGDSYINDIEPSIKLGFNTLQINYVNLVSSNFDFNKDVLEQLKEKIFWL